MNVDLTKWERRSDGSETATVGQAAISLRPTPGGGSVWSPPGCWWTVLVGGREVAKGFASDAHYARISASEAIRHAARTGRIERKQTPPWCESCGDQDDGCEDCNGAA